MVTGVHAVFFTRDYEGARAFFRDVLGFCAVDAEGGWLIFALPPAELAAHPTDRALRARPPRATGFPAGTAQRARSSTPSSASSAATVQAASR